MGVTHQGNVTQEVVIVMPRNNRNPEIDDQLYAKGLLVDPKKLDNYRSDQDRTDREGEE